MLADHISASKGQSIIVESRPGAGGVIAAEAVARAPPDGSTLLINNNGMIISAILRKVNYDPQSSFEPICYLVTTPQIIAVNGASPYRTLAELVEAARKKPGELSIASVGPNTTQHIGIERFKRLAHANLTYIPYPGGAPTVSALLGAHVASAVLNWSEIGEQLIAGKARALATMALKRIEPLPDLPTVAESGYADFETDVWFGLVAPAKTPKETIAQLIDWFSAALLAPEVKSKLTAQARTSPSAISSMNPAASAASTLRGLPSSINVSAASNPTSRGMRCVPPAPGSSPRLTSGRPILVPGDATR